MKNNIKKLTTEFLSNQEHLNTLLSEKTFKDMSWRYKQLVHSSINITWQSWSNLIREIWLVAYYTNSLNHAYFKKNLTVDQALFRIKNNNSEVKSLMFYHEPTWGDVDCINRIASHYNTNSTFAQNIVSPLSIYKDNIKDFQIIRNSAIHFSNGGMRELKTKMSLRLYTRNDSNHPISYLQSSIGVSSRFAYQDIADCFIDYLTIILSSNNILLK